MWGWDYTFVSRVHAQHAGSPKSHPQQGINRVWCHMPAMPTLGTQRQ